MAVRYRILGKNLVDHKEHPMYQSKQYFSCCGCIELSQFGWDYSDPTANWSKSDLVRFLQEAKHCYRHKAMLIATLNQRQQNLIGHIFRDNGFTKVAQGYNGSERNINFLYACTFDMGNEEKAPLD